MKRVYRGGIRSVPPTNGRMGAYREVLPTREKGRHIGKYYPTREATGRHITVYTHQRGYREAYKGVYPPGRLHGRHIHQFIPQGVPLGCIREVYTSGCTSRGVYKEVYTSGCTSGCTTVVYTRCTPGCQQWYTRVYLRRETSAQTALSSLGETSAQTAPLLFPFHCCADSSRP